VQSVYGKGIPTMNKSVPAMSNAKIRAIEPKDFAFIRSLAAGFQTFTVPSEYLLWFLARFHPECCRVIEQESGALKAYLLAMRTGHPRDGIAIWQIAAAKPDHAFALEYFAEYLRSLVESERVNSVFFTTTPDSSSLRLISSLAKQFADCEVVQLDPVPSGQGEYEFRLSIDRAQHKSEMS
jgi:hypothetical protein